MSRDPTGYPRLATRGSFASEQAKLGTELLHASGLAWVWDEYIDSGYTPLFEICGPSNRIVLQYAVDFLQPLGYIHMLSGEFVPPAGAERRTMGDLLMDLSRSNAEGWVVWLSNRQAVKIKQADYIELHRMVSNLNEKEVWRQLRSGMYKTYVEQLPDELFALADEWRFQLQDRFIEIHTQAHLDLMQTPVTTGRKDSALWINANVPARTRGLVFGLLDGKDISDAIWRLLEPSGGVQ
jgi:RNA ligase